MIGIYGFKEKETGKWYIGRSADNMIRRIRDHFYGNSIKAKFDLVCRDKGIKAFDIYCLCEFPKKMAVSKRALNLLEDYFILKYDALAPDGLNGRFNARQDLRGQIDITKGLSHLSEIYVDCYPDEDGSFFKKCVIKNENLNSYFEDYVPRVVSPLIPNNIKNSCQQLVTAIGKICCYDVNSVRKFESEVWDSWNNSEPSDNEIVNTTVQLIKLLN